jgi:hypothetical protein
VADFHVTNPINLRLQAIGFEPVRIRQFPEIFKSA